MRTPDLGVRISLRRQHESDPHSASDVVGDVVARDDESITVQPWDRPAVRVPLADVLVWRAVPPRAVRLNSTPADLARLAARGWPGLELQRVGGWELRAGDHYTGRANSALPEGDPGCPVGQALERLVAFYRERGLPPQLQLVSRPGHPHPLEAALRRDGWHAAMNTTFMAADLRRLPGADQPTPVGVRWAETPDGAWLEAQGRPHPSRVAVLTAAPASYLSIDTGAAHGLDAIARVAITADWAGFTCVWVAPGLRGRGLATAVMGECVRHARAHGARFGYLQVVSDNTVARRLYLRLGWADHHDYSYWTLEDAA